MKKIFKKLVMGALILTPLMFAPHTSKANIVGDLLNLLTGDKDDKPGTPAGSSGNSVPVDGGLVFLVVAGLGLGGKMLYDYNKKSQAEPTSI